MQVLSKMEKNNKLTLPFLFQKTQKSHFLWNSKSVPSLRLWGSRKVRECYTLVVPLCRSCTLAILFQSHRPTPWIEAFLQRGDDLRNTCRKMNILGTLRCYDGNATTTVKTRSFIQMVVKKTCCLLSIV